MKKIMKNSLLILLSVISLNLNGQNLDIGIFAGYGFDNIANYNSNDSRTVIGNGLWDLQYGLNFTIAPKNMKYEKTMRYSFQVKVNPKGTVSEINEKDKFNFNTTQLGLAIGYGGNIGNELILYFDGGLAYNLVQNEEIFEGELSQTSAFPDLSDELLIKSNEIAFIYAIGIEKYINERFKWNLEFAGDAGITEINENIGALRTQGIYLNFGIKYTIGNVNTISNKN